MPPKNKGKARADTPTESSPLLERADDDASTRSIYSGISGSSSTPSALYTVDTPATGHAHRRSRRFAILISVFSLFLGVAVFVVLFAASFIPSDMEKENMHEAFVYRDPKVDILNVTNDGVHITLSLQGAVDVNRALAVDGSRGEGWWETLRRGAAHGVLGALPTQAINITIPKVQVYALGGLPLLEVFIPDDIAVPLSQDGTLVPITIQAVGNPVAPAGVLWGWAQKTWAKGTIHVSVVADEAHASIPGAWWSKWAVLEQRDIHVPLAVPVPPVPNLPPPGTPLDLSKLVTLHKYSFSTDRGLKLSATASLPNPSLRSVPFAIPFAIQIGPEHETIAQVVARASKVTTTTIGLAIDGDIVALESGNALDTFLQNFLHGESNPILVRGLDHMPPGSWPDAPPDWALDSLPSLELDLEFPASRDRPDIVREVTIEDLKLGQGNSGMIANGTVVANVQLPEGMERVALNVSAICPDVMIHDGAVEDEDEPYDPENPPPRAFGRIAPSFYLASTTSPSDQPPQLVVRAPFTDLPLQILPGRDGVLSEFISKIVFKGGAMAGIKGVVDVKADIGVGGTLEVNDLPVTGEFWAGRGVGLALKRLGL